MIGFTGVHKCYNVFDAKHMNSYVGSLYAGADKNYLFGMGKQVDEPRLDGDI